MTELAFERHTTTHGYDILARKPFHHSSPPSEIILALRTRDESHRFVVWRMEAESGECHGGEYFSSLVNAVYAFTQRHAGTP